MIDIKQNSLLVAVVSIVSVMILTMGGLFNHKMESLDADKVWGRISELIPEETAVNSNLGFLILDEGCTGCEEIEKEWEQMISEQQDIARFISVGKGGDIEDGAVKDYLMQLAESASHPLSVSTPYVLGIQKGAGIVTARNGDDKEALAALAYRFGAAADELNIENDSSDFKFEINF